MPSDVRTGVPSAIAPLSLHYLDLVAVRILHEEEPDREPTVAVTLLDRGGIKAEARTLLVLVFKIIHREGDMPVGRSREYRAQCARGLR